MKYPISQKAFAALSALDSCSVANAIEYFDVEPRNAGFTDGGIACRFPSLPVMLGYATTLRIRAASIPWISSIYLGRDDWWARLQLEAAPHVVVIQDMDKKPGTGAFVGEVHAAILRAMGCAGAITNGAVRGLPEVERIGFPLFSASIAVSHAYIHIVEVGGDVEIGGLSISPGDLIHGDVHGIVKVPLEIAAQVPRVAQRIRDQERQIVKYCHSPGFDTKGLEPLIAKNTCGAIVREGSAIRKDE